jgi:excisionase family DNA binding protein
MSLFQTNSLNNKLLTRPEAAQYLGVTEQTLAVWACVKRYNLPYVKVGRLVKYRLTDLDAFLASRTVQQTAQEGV